jgi:hypothetical protein
MKHFKYYIFLMGCLLVIQCGVDVVEEGKKAYADGDYSQAIKRLTEAREKDSTNTMVNEMIFLSYLYRGEELFKRTNNVDAFVGNIELASKYLPKEPTAQFNKMYSKKLLSLANAYLSARATNEEEKNHFFDKAVNIAKQSIYIDSTNTAADSLLDKMKNDHFQNLIDKGKNFYDKARRTGNADLYFTAVYYLKEAMQFEADNTQIFNLMQKIRRKTLPVLNYREDVSLAVAGIKRERKAVLMTLSIKNYTSQPISLLLNNFKLVDKDGSGFGINEDEIKKRELFGETGIKNSVLNIDNPSTQGIIAFDAPKDIQIAYIHYQIDKKRFARKYFPKE